MTFSLRTAALACSVAVLSLTGCSTGRLDAQWSDPELATKPVKATKVYVVCEAVEQTIARLCQDELASQLRTVGATPVMGTLQGPGAQHSAAAQAAGADSAIVARIGARTAVYDRGPAFGFGIGGGSGHFGSGVGISMPIGGSVGMESSYVSDTTVTQAGSGKLRWSGTASSSQSNAGDQIRELMRVTVESARKAGAI